MQSFPILQMLLPHLNNKQSTIKYFTSLKIQLAFLCY